MRTIWRGQGDRLSRQNHVAVISCTESILLGKIKVKKPREMKSQGSKEDYDRHYAERVARFQKLPETTAYYKMWRKAINLCCQGRHDLPRILEIGCGPGQFAQMLFKRGVTSYVGLDFSETAVSIARQMNPDHAGQFCTEDVLVSDALVGDYDVAVALEVLEHVPRDIELLSRIPADKHVVMSVPNFDAKFHVRVFQNEASVHARYGKLIDVRELFSFSLSGSSRLFLLDGKRTTRRDIE